MNRFNPLPLLTSDRPVDRRAACKLVPVAFGTPDPALGKLVLQTIAEATPPAIIPAHPVTLLRVRTFLRHLGA